MIDTLLNTYNSIVDFCGFWGLLLIIATIVLLLIQLYFHVRLYGSINKYRNDSRDVLRDEKEGISVVVLIKDNLWYLENTLPLILGQNYPEFEVVIVDIGSTEEFDDQLALIKSSHSNLITTKINLDPRFPVSNKMAYNVGIKACSYANIILTTANSTPISKRWLTCMGKGFSSGDVIIAYCGVECKTGLVNKIIRCSRFMQSVRFLSSAIKGRPYRGMIHNLGLRRELYFENRGFNHLDMNLGEDDLFIQRIATAENTSVVMNPHATVKQEQWGGLGWWWRERRFYSTTHTQYPLWAKNQLQWEMGSRLLFYITCITLLVIMPWQIKIVAAVLWLIRLLVVSLNGWRIRRRLHERGIGWMMIFYDLIAPFTELALSISCKIRPPAGIWR